MLPVQAILIDLDDTLLDDRAATRHALLAFVAAHRQALPLEDEADAIARWRRIMAAHWTRHERGEISFVEQRRARVRDFLALELNDSAADAAFEPYRLAYESAWSPVPECAEFVRRTALLPKVIVTNGDRSQQLRKIEATGLAEHFLGVVTPEDCGQWKPNPMMFSAALAKLNVDPSACLMIGDDPVRDIEPARRLGMRTFCVATGHPDRSLLHALAMAT